MAQERAEERDRTKRYANPPKHGKKKPEGKAAAEVETAEHKEGAGKGPTDADPGKVGKAGADKGPSAKESGPEFGVVAERHKREHGDTLKRHGEEMGATHERHGKELKDMHARHSKEMQDHAEQGAEHKADASAGKPKELGKDRAEGKKGSET